MAAEKNLSTACFKAYDICGWVPDELNEELAYRLGRAFAAFLRPEKVAVDRESGRIRDELCCTEGFKTFNNFE